MKKKLMILIFTVLMLSILALSGCGKGNTVDADAGEQIKSLKSKNADAFSTLLDEGIEDEKDSFALDFPEDLKKPYLEFLQNAFAQVEFEADAAEEKSDGSYSIYVKFKPLNIEESTKSINSEYQNTLKSTDLTAETSALLEKDIKALEENKVYNDETSVTIQLKKDGEKYVITDKSLSDLISASLYDYMTPYESICEILDTQDYMTAYLDACFNKDFERFMKHTGKSLEEMKEWNAADIFAAPDEFPEDLGPRYSAAVESIYKQCQYSVGIPKKDAAYTYKIDITFTPNNSLSESINALSSGTYYSEQEVYESLVNTLEAYAASPVFGAEDSRNITLDINSLLNADKENSELSNLILAIFPVPAMPE